MKLAGFPRIFGRRRCLRRPPCHRRDAAALWTDVVEMRAGGVSPAKIAADFPYVTENDVRAVLAYPDHRVVLAAESCS
jgi:hypothetical protein